MATLGCAEAPEDASLVNAFATAVDTTVGTQLHVSRMAPTAWDTVWLFGPYSVQPSLTIDHPAVGAARRTSVIADERSNAIVLMSGRRVVSYAEVPRNVADFDLGGANRMPLPRSAAILTVCQDTLRDRRVLAVNATRTRSWIVCEPESPSDPLSTP